ncbi:hypothetical protein AAG570_007665 [Ranatra chinensis]|uniref:UNC93-like protein n=1 Tax=Ranatra chinensis TaxID=642074 RepID=A0ABD0XU68_9HEMI
MGSLPNLRDLHNQAEMAHKSYNRSAANRGMPTSNHNPIRQTTSVSNYTNITLTAHHDKLNHFFTTEVEGLSSPNIGASAVPVPARVGCFSHAHCHRIQNPGVTDNKWLAHVVETQVGNLLPVEGFDFLSAPQGLSGTSTLGCEILRALKDAVAYSPVSTRSMRSSWTIHHHHLQNNLLVRRNSRHRDSMSSSGGASSVRRLIAVVRSTPSESGPVYSRKLLFRNFAALCLGHGMVTAAVAPLLTLQASISVWRWEASSQDVGSWLLASLFAVASLSSLGAVFLVDQLGTNWTLVLGYGGACVFLGVHLYPDVYTLVPAYLFMGAWLGPSVEARFACLMTLASKLTYVMTEEEEDEVECARGFGRTEVVVHRLFRGLQIAQDFGLIIGNAVTSILIWYTTAGDSESNLDSMFLLENDGDRVCGSACCPFFMVIGDSDNSTQEYDRADITCKTSTMLVSIFLGFCVMGVAVTAAFMDHIRELLRRDPKYRNVCNSYFRLMQDAFKDTRLQMAAPLSLFIGLEQGFMFADFTKSYVACAIGVTNISMVFLSLGLLQSIAAFTLSLLLQHIRRHIIIAVGFIFQACLLLVLLLWKPSREDPALFYVVPAAWGVCNAIWDTLSFSLLVSVYPESWQAPFAHSYFFRYLGLAVAFGTHSSLCNWLKLYTLAGAMLIAVTPYTWLEVRHESRRKLKSQLSNL